MSALSHQIRLMQINNSPNSISKAKAEEEIKSPNSDGEEMRLPREIWLEIGKRLQSRLDVLRFRSVCRTWRRCLPPPLRFPLRVPRPPGPSPTDEQPSHFFIAEVTFYAAANEMIVLFEEESRGGEFSASAFVHQSVIRFMKFELPPVNEIRNFSFLCNAYHVHDSLQRHSDSKRAENFCNLNVLKIVIICSDGAIVNPNYPRLGDLKVVAHLIDRKLAVLSLRGGAIEERNRR